MRLFQRELAEQGLDRRDVGLLFGEGAGNLGGGGGGGSVRGVGASEREVEGPVRGGPARRAGFRLPIVELVRTAEESVRI